MTKAEMIKRMRSSNLYLFIIVVALSLFLDQWSKTILFDYLPPNDLFVRVNKYLNIVFTLNYGISFGIFSQNAYNAYIFVGISLVAIIYLGYLFYTTNNMISSFSYGMLIGGAIGNVIDRIKIGAVIDFIDIHWYEYHWPAFNVADIFIVSGVTILMIEMLFTVGERK